MVAWVVVILLAVALMTYDAMRPVSPPGRPQLGVVVSADNTPTTDGGSGAGGRFGCTTVAVVTVRLNNGRIVRAASTQFDIHHDALVTVAKYHLFCTMENYLILHAGPPNPERYRNSIGGA